MQEPIPMFCIVCSARPVNPGFELCQACFERTRPVPRASSTTNAVETRHGTCIVMGSINMEVQAAAEVAWPALGVSYGSSCEAHGHFLQSRGGHGANAAVAVACLGVGTTLVGRVGDDPNGAQLLAGLRTVPLLDTSHVRGHGSHSARTLHCMLCAPSTVWMVRCVSGAGARPRAV
jgi:hypothetical protein